MLTLLTIVGGLVALAVEGMGRSSSNAGARARVQHESEEALREMQRELSRSGFVTLNGKQYPYVFEAGVAEDPFAAHSHPPPSGADYDKARGLREIVFVLPADLDGDGRPDRDADRDGVPELDGDGDGVRTDDAADVDGLWDPLENTIDPATGVAWSHREVSYVITTDPDGRDCLWRRVDAGEEGARRLASGVVVWQADTPVSSGYLLPFETVGLQLELCEPDRRGWRHAGAYETLVRLAN